MEQAPGRAARGPSRGVALAMIVTAGACWGLAAVIAKTAFERGVPPVRMAEARVVVALVVLLAILAWRRRGPLLWAAAAATLVGAVLVSRAYAGLSGVSAAGVVAGAASAVFFALY